VHITCAERLEPYWYDATYLAGDKSFRGKYLPQKYELGPRHGYLFMGTFERTQDDRAQPP
jgi:hypothetical protein